MYDIRWIRENAEAFDRGLKSRGAEPLSTRLLGRTTNGVPRLLILNPSKSAEMPFRKKSGTPLQPRIKRAPMR